MNRLYVFQLYSYRFLISIYYCVFAFVVWSLRLRKYLNLTPSLLFVFPSLPLHFVLFRIRRSIGIYILLQQGDLILTFISNIGWLPVIQSVDGRFSMTAAALICVQKAGLACLYRRLWYLWCWSFTVAQSFCGSDSNMTMLPTLCYYIGYNGYGIVS